VTELLCVGAGAPARTWLWRDERNNLVNRGKQGKRERNKKLHLFFTGIFPPEKRF
jgi:hypothetical protein